MAFLQRSALTLAIAASVFTLALDGGGYALTTRSSAGLAIWWIVGLAVALAVWPLAKPSRAALSTGGLLAALAALTALSMAWSDSAEKAFAEFERVTLYLGIFTVTVAAGTRANARRWNDGLAIGIVAVGLLALASRLYPHLLTADDQLLAFMPSLTRLSYPLQYWNGLAIFVALAFPLLLGAAVTERAPVFRGLALAPLPALIAVIYLTSSRGGVAVALAGSIVFVALAGRRLAAIVAVAVTAAGSVAVIGVLQGRSELVDGPLHSAAAAAQGKSAAPLIALTCLAVGLLYGLAAHLLPRPGLRLKIGFKAAVAVGAVLLVGAGVAAANPQDRLERFKRPPDLHSTPEQRGYTESHLLSGGGSGRWQFWHSAVDEFKSRPAAGRGAGSYEAWWAAHGSLAYFVRDAHSLYLEMLGELGVIGLFLLVAFLGGGVITGALRLRKGTDDERTLKAALIATVLAFALGAGIDWVWELTVVAAVAVAALGLLTGPATAPATAGGPVVGSPARELFRWRASSAGIALRTAVVAAALALAGQASKRSNVVTEAPR